MTAKRKIQIVIDMMMKRMVKKDTDAVKCSIVSKITVLAVCSYGIYALVKRKLGTYLFLKSESVFFDFSEPLLMFFADYITNMILFGFIGKQLGVLCKTRRKADD